ncbi:hypothetical protein C8R44DRAFT_941591 [Mycena epipterygia]|nr:hypothetical protein C8R44DRAFT_941591 [Mycena epipterygia]
MIEKKPSCRLEVKASKAVKLVGIWLDKGLTFKEQGVVAVGKGHEWLVVFQRIANISKGIAPWLIRQFYLVICMPHMFYGAEVFLAPVYQQKHRANQKKDNWAVIKKFWSIQLKATRMIVGRMISSPGDLLDVHADLPLMHLATDHAYKRQPSGTRHSWRRIHCTQLSRILVNGIMPYLYLQNPYLSEVYLYPTSKTSKVDPSNLYLYLWR